MTNRETGRRRWQVTASDLTNARRIDHVRVERLANGFLSVYDYRAQWQVLYNPDGTYRHGGVDHPDYRRAVRQYLDTVSRAVLR